MSEPASLFDTGVWVALTFPSHPLHGRSRDALSACTRDMPALFCRATQQSFLRIITTTTVQRHYGAEGLCNADALELLEGYLALPNVDYREEPIGLFPTWRQQAARPTASSRLWMDACLAAFAIAGGYRLVTADQAFKQFEGLYLRLLEKA